MELEATYFHAEILANMISQTRHVLQNLKIKNLFSPQALVIEYQTIHFGGVRGSGHGTAIEALTHIYVSEIICAKREHTRHFRNIKLGTKVRTIEEVMQPGIKQEKKVEVVFIDNWSTIILPHYPDLPKMLYQLEGVYNASQNNTVFALIH